MEVRTGYQFCHGITWKVKTPLNTFICKHFKWIWLVLIWEQKFIDM